MKINKTMTAVSAAVSLCAAIAKADTKTYAVTNDWDSVSSERYTSEADLSSANGWSKTDGYATVADGEIVLADKTAAPCRLTYTPDAPAATNKKETLYLHVNNVRFGSFTEALPDGNPQAALKAAVDGTKTNWYGLSDGDWVALTGATPALGDCNVRIEFDNSNNLVRHSVRQGDASDYTVLKNGEAEWLANGVSNPERINYVSFGGRGKLTGLELEQTGYVTMSDAQQAKMQAQGIEDLNEVAENGNPNWENLVLGLDGRNENAKPVVTPVQTADAGKLTLKLGGVDIDTGSGATVTYKVIAFDGEHQKVGESAQTAHGANAEVDLPESGVRYYQYEVVTKPADGSAQ